MDISKENKLSELIMRHLHGDNSPQDLQQLKQLLQDDAEAVELYVEYMMQFTALNQPGKVAIEGFSEAASPSLLDPSLWTALSKYETEAPGIELPKEKPQQELIREVVYSPREKRNIKKFSLVVLINVAAIILFFVFLRFAPVKGGIEVATLTDSINAKWADVGVSMANGTRLTNDKSPLLLREGLVQLKFDNNAQVTIEGPAEFQIFDDDMMKLNYGQLYSHVPAEAYGFQVSTQHAKIIDLGTEFGIKEGLNGNTEVHVLKGQVNLISNISGQKINLNLLAGSARELDADTGEMKEIACEDESFVRQIDSKTNLIWKGHNVIPLTNILAGTLFEEVPGGIEIDPATGRSVIHEDYIGGWDRSAAKEYHLSDSPFVDGTFVPLGELPQVISSTQLTWQSPKTSGGLYYNLSDRKKIHDLSTGAFYSLVLAPADNPTTSLLLHPNMGVTLDLDMIRKKLPTLHIRGFRAEAGISAAAKETLEKLYPDGNIPEKDRPIMDFTILLDGKVRKSLTGISLESWIDKINVEIHPADRFLTLVSTDANQSYQYDWFVLADPVLDISPDE